MAGVAGAISSGFRNEPKIAAAPSMPAAAPDIDLGQPEIGDEFGMGGEQFEKQLQLLQLQHAVLAEHLGLGGLAGRLLLEIEPLGVALGLAAVLGEQRDLDRGLGGDDVALLVGGRARLLGLLALLLRGLLLHIGGAQLAGELLALAGEQQFGRDRGFAEPDLLDVDAGAAAVDLRAFENRLFEHRAVLDRVEHAGRPRHLDERALVVRLLQRDRAAIDVAHERTDRGHENALVDLLLAADRGHHDRRILRRDLDDRAQLLRNLPALDLGVDRRIRGILGLLEGGGALGLGEVAARIDLQVDVAPGEAALEFERGDAGRDQRDVIGVAIEIIVVGRQRGVPDALAILGDEFGGEAAVVGLGGARLAVDPRALDARADDADRAGGHAGDRGVERRLLLGEAAQVIDVVVVGDDVPAVADEADLDLEQREIERIDAGLEHAELQALLAAMGHEIFGVEIFLIVLLGPGVGHDLTGRERLAVGGDDAPVEAVGHDDDRQEIDPVEHVEEDRDAERSRRDDLGLVAGLAVGRDEMAGRDIGEAVDLAHDADLARRNRDHAGREHLVERDDAEDEAQRRDQAEPPPPGERIGNDARREDRGHDRRDGDEDFRHGDRLLRRGAIGRGAPPPPDARRRAS